MGVRFRTSCFGSSRVIYDHKLPGGTLWGLQHELSTGKSCWEQRGCVTHGADPLFMQEEVGMVSRYPLKEITRGRGAKAKQRAGHVRGQAGL